jgi:very-short-patch-repair endonuclease
VDLEVFVRLGSKATACHETAAQLWGIELVGTPLHRVTVPLSRSRLAVPGWQVRRMDLPDDDVVVVDEVRRTVPLRTVLDLAMVLPHEEAVAAADSALRQGLVDSGDLVTALSGRLGRGARRPRAVAQALDPLAGSVLESLLRVLLRQAGLPAPQTQHVVSERDGTFVARVDMAWPGSRLVVEADGFAFHSDRESYRSDRHRVNALERLGWRVLRFSWEDVRYAPEDVVRTVRSCLAAAA